MLRICLVYARLTLWKLEETLRIWKKRLKPDIKIPWWASSTNSQRFRILKESSHIRDKLMQLVVLDVARAASFRDFHVSSLICYCTERTAKIRTRSSLKKRTWYRMSEIERMPLERKQRQTYRIEKVRGGPRSLLAQLWASATICLLWFTTTK